MGLHFFIYLKPPKIENYKNKACVKTLENVLHVFCSGKPKPKDWNHGWRHNSSHLWERESEGVVNMPPPTTRSKGVKTSGFSSQHQHRVYRTYLYQQNTAAASSVKRGNKPTWRRETHTGISDRMTLSRGLNSPFMSVTLHMPLSHHFHRSLH